MTGKLDTVFVASNYWANPPTIYSLEWVFKNFDKDKTKIIVTTHYPDNASWTNVFINVAQNTYLPRCRTAQFQAEILMPQAYQPKEATLELLTKHGMNKLVLDANFAGHILPAFEVSPNSSCKIWFINPSSTLDSVRQFGPDPLTELAPKEVEKYKKIADEETTKRKIIEEKLVIMTEQAEQKIGQLTQENEQLKKNAVLSTYITFEELAQATENFNDSLKIGEGGSGSVYKGIFRGTTVAVKKFKSRNKQALSKFQEEVVILSTVRHPNLVTLIGACSEPPALVYEFLENGSLHNNLTQTGMPLHWKARTRIISEICLALVFLHSNKPTPIIHGDLKPDNIFLDANLTSKLSDFGIIKQEYTSTKNEFDQPIDPERTHAYKDPRYFRTGKLTLESDVYSFGVIILRLLTGKTPFDIREEVENDMGTNEFHTDESAGLWPPDHAKKMAEIGIRCAHDSWTKRPHLVNEVWPIIKDLLKFPEEAI